jgi:hypothetical protein
MMADFANREDLLVDLLLGGLMLMAGLSLLTGLAARVLIVLIKIKIFHKARILACFMSASRDALILIFFLTLPIYIIRIIRILLINRVLQSLYLDLREGY